MITKQTIQITSFLVAMSLTTLQSCGRPHHYQEHINNLNKPTKTEKCYLGYWYGNRDYPVKVCQDISGNYEHPFCYTAHPNNVHRQISCATFFELEDWYRQRGYINE